MEWGAVGVIGLKVGVVALGRHIGRPLQCGLRWLVGKWNGEEKWSGKGFESLSHR